MLDWPGWVCYPHPELLVSAQDGMRYLSPKGEYVPRRRPFSLKQVPAALLARLARRIPCSCCGQTARGPVVRLQDDVGDTVDVRCCAVCHALVPLYDPVEDEVRRQTMFHEDSWRHSWKHETRDALLEQRDNIAVMLSDFRRAGQIPPPAPGVRVFDIGAGRGNLTAAAVQAGYAVNACEPSQALSQTAQKIYELPEGVLETSGVTEFLARHAAKVGTVSIIFLWHVLEHLKRPVDVLADLRPFLRPDGVILCQGPMLSRHNLFPAHRLLHTPRNIAWLARELDLKLLRIDYSRQESFITFKFGLPVHPAPALALEESADGLSELVDNFMAAHDEILHIMSQMTGMIDERGDAIEEMGREIHDRDLEIAKLRFDLAEMAQQSHSQDNDRQGDDGAQASGSLPGVLKD